MNDVEIRERLEKLPGWILNKGRLEKTFSFANFARAAVFFNKMVNPVEEFSNYPVIVVAYNRVSISIFDNVAGRLSEKDFSLASALERLADNGAIILPDRGDIGYS